jgi:hypothetical protein
MYYLLLIRKSETLPESSMDSALFADFIRMQTPCHLRHFCAVSSLRLRYMATARSRSIIDALDVRLPLLNIGSDEAAVVGDETVDLALDIGGLSVDGTTAGILLSLLADVTHEDTRAVVVRLEVSIDLVGLVNGVNCLLDVPETGETEN